MSARTSRKVFSAVPIDEFSRVKAEAKGTELSDNFLPGYACFFVSNEHPTYADIYFDDVSVSHTQSPIVSGSDYYPFGLVMDSMEITDEKYRYGLPGPVCRERRNHRLERPAHHLRNNVFDGLKAFLSACCDISGMSAMDFMN